MRPPAPQMLRAQRDHLLRQSGCALNHLFVDLTLCFVLHASDLERDEVMAFTAARPLPGLAHDRQRRQTRGIVGAKETILRAC
jgi:hypothetical protein